MNRKGFTLIELLAVIIIIGILTVLIAPGILNNITTAKESSYNTLIKNIVSSSQIYYEECEYGDLSDNIKYEGYACSISSNTITTTLGALANTGILNVKDVNESGTKIVKDPKTNKDISNCKIKIKKIVEQTTYKVTYQVTNNDTRNICPSTY